jgi:protein tyrosine phosphatase/predicted NAD-dependent protein-ADP-ribosyltransferase YbiA (DUF1768 family)
MIFATSPIADLRPRAQVPSVVNPADLVPVDTSPHVEKEVVRTSSPISPTDVEQMIKKALANRCLLFSPEHKNYFFLCNDFPSPLEFDKLHYTCATSAYEAQKFFHRRDLMERFQALNAQQAFAFSAEKHLEKHPGWYAKREETMCHVLRAKFGQNIPLQRLLLLTADAYLSFHTPIKAMDPFWTDDSDGSGANRFGQLLMAIRNEYGGIKGAPRPANYIDLIPNRKIETATNGPLNKSPDEVFAEIEQLNGLIDDKNYKQHSQIARSPANHRYTRFPCSNFPYDGTLVSLSSLHYINASFVFGKQFIGTQSPLPDTSEDFWSMVLEHDVPIVIMLNRLGDPGDYIYFPFSLSDKKTYGMIHLELTEEPLFTTDPSWRQTPHEEEPHAVIHRKLKIWREGETPRHVDHFQYQNWHDFSAGNERAAAYLVKTVDAIRREKPELPVAIHCHAGVGRTSVMITLLEQYPHLATGKIDIKNSVERQRSPNEGRCNSMMQSPNQYAFCYRVLRLLS